MSELAINADGGGAAGPTEIPARGWRDVLMRTWKESEDDNVGLIAAGVAFYSFVAFVPLLASIMLIYGLVADPLTVARHIQRLFEILPGEAAGLIGEQLRGMTEGDPAPKGFALLLALLLALYGSMKGASAVIIALNVANEVHETRSFLRTNAIALLITLGAIVAVMVAIAATAALGFVDRLLPTSAPILHTALKLLFWIVAALVTSALLATVYRYAPNRPNAQWRWLSPGSLAATLLVLAATLGFGFYVANFGNYNATYGSLGAVVVFLTWLYLSAYIVLMGAELNTELEKQARSDAP